LGEFALTKLTEKSVFAIVLSGVGLLSVACPKTPFGGDTKKEPKQTAVKTVVPTPGVGATISPVEPEAWPTPSKPTVECADSTRAVRIALIVDTSQSMDGIKGCAEAPSATATPSATESWGTDYKRNGTSIRNTSECFNDRQNAIYHIVTRTAALDEAALKVNPNYIGSEIGIAHFPLGDQNQENSLYGTISGRPPLKSKMTNLGGIKLDDPAKEELWNVSKRVQTSAGITPYAAAVQAAKDLLKTGRDPNDPRLDVVLMLTDGLPTDERPSEVLRLKEELADTRWVTMFLYDPTVAKQTQESEFKTSLKKAFDEKGWARQPNNTDGYGAGEFEKYWADLTAIPGKISNERIDISSSSKIIESFDNVLNIIQKCR
jgi:hypothetical protein